MSPDDEDENNDDEKDDGNAETDRDDEASFIHPLEESVSLEQQN